MVDTEAGECTGRVATIHLHFFTYTVQTLVSRGALLQHGSECLLGLVAGLIVSFSIFRSDYYSVVAMQQINYGKIYNSNYIQKTKPNEQSTNSENKAQKEFSKLLQ